jgi:hypothetical protein
MLVNSIDLIGRRVHRPESKNVLVKWLCLLCFFVAMNNSMDFEAKAFERPSALRDLDQRVPILDKDPVIVNVVLDQYVFQCFSQCKEIRDALGLSGYI